MAGDRESGDDRRGELIIEKMKGRLKQSSVSLELGGASRAVSTARLAGERRGQVDFCNDREAVELINLDNGETVIRMVIGDGADSTGEMGGKLMSFVLKKLVTAGRKTLDGGVIVAGAEWFLRSLKKKGLERGSGISRDFWEKLTTGGSVTGVTLDSNGDGEGIHAGDTVAYVVKNNGDLARRLTAIQNEAGLAVEELMTEVEGTGSMMEAAINRGLKQKILKGRVEVRDGEVELKMVRDFRVYLHKGDVLVLVTDGVSKAFPDERDIAELVKRAILEGYRSNIAQYIVEKAYFKTKREVGNGRVDAITAVAVVW